MRDLKEKEAHQDDQRGVKASSFSFVFCLTISKANYTASHPVEIEYVRVDYKIMHVQVKLIVARVLPKQSIRVV